jgi:hypothetical protein
MKLWTFSFALLVGFGSLERSTLAQSVKLPEHGTAIDAGAPNSAKYYNLTNSFDPWGITGVPSGYLGAGLSGYGPGSTLNNQFLPWPATRSTQATQPGRGSTATVAPTAPKIKNNSRNVTSPKPVPKTPSRKAP